MSVVAGGPRPLMLPQSTPSSPFERRRLSIEARADAPRSAGLTRDQPSSAPGRRLSYVRSPSATGTSSADRKIDSQDGNTTPRGRPGGVTPVAFPGATRGDLAGIKSQRRSSSVGIASSTPSWTAREAPDPLQFARRHSQARPVSIRAGPLTPAGQDRRSSTSALGAAWSSQAPTPKRNTFALPPMNDKSGRKGLQRSQSMHKAAGSIDSTIDRRTSGSVDYGDLSPSSSASDRPSSTSSFSHHSPESPYDALLRQAHQIASSSKAKRPPLAPFTARTWAREYDEADGDGGIFGSDHTRGLISTPLRSRPASRQMPRTPSSAYPASPADIRPERFQPMTLDRARTLARRASAGALSGAAALQAALDAVGPRLPVHGMRRSSSSARPSAQPGAQPLSMESIAAMRTGAPLSAQSLSFSDAFGRSAMGQDGRRSYNATHSALPSPSASLHPKSLAKVESDIGSPAFAILQSEAEAALRLDAARRMARSLRSKRHSDGGLFASSAAVAALRDDDDRARKRTLSAMAPKSSAHNLSSSEYASTAMTSSSSNHSALGLTAVPAPESHEIDTRTSTGRLRRLFRRMTGRPSDPGASPGSRRATLAPSTQTSVAMTAMTTLASQQSLSNGSESKLWKGCTGPGSVELEPHAPSAPPTVSTFEPWSLEAHPKANVPRRRPAHNVAASWKAEMARGSDNGRQSRNFSGHGPNAFPTLHSWQQRADGRTLEAEPNALPLFYSFNMPFHPFICHRVEDDPVSQSPEREQP
ncbi:hypothetical protein CBOM_01463 [Ceraceosorus bombacis]|uniref:Uncharacterized protein n=1 Tax=Ceraceosorus bombacis TaxID=401625 RepID=A0A0P1BBP4_9BASI|nr:hypothetical protein CBOM_01463 [Ceraceosorus bombacis]